MSIEAVVRHWARDARILVVGDAMLDEYVLGEVSRISPEAPVPIVEVSNVVRRPGGAANVAAILAGFGARVELCAVVGEDEDGEHLRELLERDDVDARGLVSLASQRTGRKQRVFCRGQQLIRCDYERHHELPAAEDAAHAQLAAKLVEGVIAVVIADYRKGVCTQNVCAAVLDAAQKARVPVVVDPKRLDWSRYLGASVIKPNLHEASLVCDCELDTDQAIEGYAAGMLCMTRGMSVVITRGSGGMSLIESGKAVLHWRAIGRPARTVIGAGDVVSAVLALGLAAGTDLADACSMANVMAGLHCERGLQLE